MIREYNRGEFENFVEAIRSASKKINERSPSYYIVSLNGGLPLFDLLTIIDRNTDPDKAIYFPGSSKIQNSAEVLTRCFENFFLEKQDQDSEENPIVSLDEVVCGSSIERLINSYNSASRRVARANLGGSQKQREYVEEESKKLREQFPLLVFGIREIRETGTKMNGKYLKRVKSREILEFPTKKIITMDNPDYQTIKFAHPNSSGFSGQGLFPKVKEIIIGEDYLNLLRDAAMFVGVDPDRIDPIRARVASDCDKYSKKPQYH